MTIVTWYVWSEFEVYPLKSSRLRPSHLRWNVGIPPLSPFSGDTIVNTKFCNNTKLHCSEAYNLLGVFTRGFEYNDDTLKHGIVERVG